MKVQISEIFDSIQGEGIYAGIPMTFIRLQGCPFRCSWCDSEYTWDMKGIGKEEEVREIIGRKMHEWVCITGGEPLSQPKAFARLVGELKGKGKRIEVETSGLVPLPCFWDYRWDESSPTGRSIFSLVDSWIPDVKCPGSGEYEKNYWPNLKILRKQDQCKFVVKDEEDLEAARRIITRRNYRCWFLISPVWPVPRAEEVFSRGGVLGIGEVGEVERIGIGEIGEVGGIGEKCVEFVKGMEKLGFDKVRVSLQMHKMIWGNRRGV